MSSGLIRFFAASFLALAAVVPHVGLAQQQAPVAAPSATNPPPAAPEGANPAGPATSGEGSTGENVDLPARPFAYVEGKADKDEIYSAILNSLSSVKREIDKARLAP